MGRISGSLCVGLPGSRRFRQREVEQKGGRGVRSHLSRFVTDLESPRSLVPNRVLPALFHTSAPARPRRPHRRREEAKFLIELAAKKQKKMASRLHRGQVTLFEEITLARFSLCTITYSITAQLRHACHRPFRLDPETRLVTQATALLFGCGCPPRTDRPDWRSQAIKAGGSLACHR